MFRRMRRDKQQLTDVESTAILERATAGVLALTGDGGYPYAVPLSFAHHDGRLFFHCATEGHKLDAVRRSSKASFCVIDCDVVRPAAYSTQYRSVIAFGQVRILEDEGERRRAIACIAEKYSPGQPDAERVIEQSLPRMCLLELTIEHLTGKAAAEPKA